MMEWVLVPLGAFVMVLGIIWMVTKAKLESRRIQYGAGRESGANAQQQRRIEQLEDRMQVLERIVTDSGYNVSAQIEALRDTRRMDEQDAGTPLDLPRKERA